jgi:MerR family transcriptional regulator, light-induced transcriptional regulator
MSGLPIREVAEQTGLAAGTIRMWEQRYGFPVPQRTSAGYRLYSDADVEALRRVVELRRTGLSVPAALERARTARKDVTEHPTIFGAVPHEGRARRLRKRTLLALSRAIEDQTMASAARPLILGAFQHERNYRAVEHRYVRMGRMADLAAVFADFESRADAQDGSPIEVPVAGDATIGHEWAVVVDAPAFAVCLSAWEPPVADPPAKDLDRVFEAFWTLDPEAVRMAAHAGAECARGPAPDVAERIDDLLDNRPQGPDVSAAALEALTSRMVGYLDGA